MTQFVKVAKTADIPAGEVIGVDIGGQRVVIANVDGEFFAIGAECTHMGGPLEDGFLEGDLLQCPWHAGEFDMKSGEGVSPPAVGSVGSFQVRVQGDDLEVEQPS